MAPLLRVWLKSGARGCSSRNIRHVSALAKEEEQQLGGARRNGYQFRPRGGIDNKITSGATHGPLSSFLEESGGGSEGPWADFMNNLILEFIWPKVSPVLSLK